VASVELRQVTKVFDDRVVAVQAADIVIKDKEFVVLVGPSGCGKSTLLRMIAGLEDISSGELLIDGRVVNPVPPKDRDIAMVFQNYALYPHKSVYENMAFGLKLRKLPQAEIDQRVKEAAEILGISHLLERKPKALSGGQRQRVAVGRAIVRKPKVFLFDEPLSNLDAKLRVQMRTEIARLHNRLQTTMIYVTHDQVEAMTMGDRIVVLRDGIVQQIDTPLELYNYPKNKFVAGFIGSPAMNFLRGQVALNEQMFFSTPQFQLALPETLGKRLTFFIGREVYFGIRPEHINCVPAFDNVAPAGGIRAKIEVLEPMGNETFVYIRLEEDAITARIAPHNELVPGNDCFLTFDLNHAHFFDMENDKAIL
jgi:multiple sugar transport system ATP-binding protein